MTPSAGILWGSKIKYFKGSTPPWRTGSTHTGFSMGYRRINTGIRSIEGVSRDVLRFVYVNGFHSRNLFTASFCISCKCHDY